MGELRRSRTKRPLRKRTIGCLLSQLQLGLVVIIVAILALTLFSLRIKDSLRSAAGTPTLTRLPTRTIYIRSPTPEFRSTPGRTGVQPTVTSRHKRVGILAGHSGPQNDPGAVCPDGLTEAEINMAVAQRVAVALRNRDYEVDLLEEFDERLENYRADVFLSIHSDSCDILEASGFKVARVSFSAIPEIEDALVDCLYKEYERATGLARHDFSITPDMHEYHAFRQIAPETPGAIIELGFMAADRYILVNQQDKLAAGIVAGLICFLER